MGELDTLTDMHAAERKEAVCGAYHDTDRRTRNSDDRALRTRGRDHEAGSDVQRRENHNQ